MSAYESPRRRLHLTVDSDSHSIIAQELTTSSESDDSVVALMLANVTQDITHLAADKAYDKSNVYQAVHDKPCDFGSRNHNATYIEEHGSYCWQAHSDYNFRASAETAMYRYKTIIGDKLYSRKLTAQKIEAKIACIVLNKMTALGMPRSI